MDDRIGKNPRFAENKGGDHIELNAFLKLHGFGSTGGQSKNIIRSGKVLVNGSVETRNKRKLFSGDKVTMEGHNLTVKAHELKMKD